ncbi:MAG: cysteine desulfurase family protein [Acidimicrobiales bacterium]
MTTTGSPDIYLDHQATTPVDERVLEAMLPYLRANFANPASAHRSGQLAAHAVDHAREQLGALVGCRPRDLVLTSGATEANNLAIKGLASAAERRHLVTCATEHPSVLAPLRRLAEEGFSLTEVGVDSTGKIDLDELAAAIRPDTLLVSVMAANNEIGTLAPIEKVSELARAVGAVVHCDATQAVGKLPFDVDEAGVDLASMSAHKLYGPKGVGALYVRRGVFSRLRPLADGGGHERGLRSGTLNVAGAVGFGAAAAAAAAEMAEEAPRLRALGELLRALISGYLPGVTPVGHPSERIPGNVTLAFRGVDAEQLMLAMPDVAVSTGSACSTAAPSPSHVLLALGLDYVAAQSVLRLGAGRFTSAADVERAAARVVETVQVLRSADAPLVADGARR